MDGLNELRISRAANYLERGASHQAIELLKQVLGDEPEHALAHALLAQALIKQRRIHAALHEAELALSLSPESPACHRTLAAVHVAHRKLALAREHAEKALELAPSDENALLQLAAIESLAGRPREALARAEQARALAPDDPETLSAVGSALLELGRVDEARRAFEDALAESAEHAESLLGMGRIALLRGDIADARAHAIAVLNVAPDHEGAIRLLVGVKTRSNFAVGLWWRMNAWLSLRPTRGVVVLVVAYLLQRALITWAVLHGHAMTESVIGYAWLALCVYSWVAPVYYRRALQRELNAVTLRSDF
jgi:Flp pilus assembly protein TadD